MGVARHVSKPIATPSYVNVLSVVEIREIKAALTISQTKASRKLQVSKLVDVGLESRGISGALQCRFHTRPMSIT